MCEKLLEVLVVDGSDSIYTTSTKIVWYLPQPLLFLPYRWVCEREREKEKGEDDEGIDGERVREKM